MKKGRRRELRGQHLVELRAMLQRGPGFIVTFLTRSVAFDRRDYIAHPVRASH
jgi:hypothetical protein